MSFFIEKIIGSANKNVLEKIEAYKESLKSKVIDAAKDLKN